MPDADRTRLDLLLVARGFFPSREKARRAIEEGAVAVDGTVVRKPSGSVAPTCGIALVLPTDRYIGRGGQKLEGAIRLFGLDFRDRIVVDAGSSTGGFTQCSLLHGARLVHAIDVGHSQLDWKIRSDPRVVVREKLNARHLTRADIPDPIDICVIDVSFISLTLILPAAFPLLAPGGVILALIKPQFELGKEEVDAGRGVVRDPAAQQRAVEKIEQFVRETLAKNWVGVIESPILGGEGNREFLACLRGL